MAHSQVNRESDLVDKLIEANGGLEYWNSLDSITTSFVFSGPALAARGFPGHHEVKLTVDLKQHRVVFHKLGPYHGVYTPFRTEVGSLDSQEPLSVRSNPRDVFPKSTWDAHDWVYFIGYAFRYYFTLPFCLRLPGFKTQELEPHQCSNGEKWRVLSVDFPDDFPTHTKHQKLLFDEAYRLRRMDYSVDVVRGKPDYHHCFDHKVFDKLIVPTFRYVSMEQAGISHMCAFIIQVDDVQTHKKSHL